MQVKFLKENLITQKEKEISKVESILAKTDFKRNFIDTKITSVLSDGKPAIFGSFGEDRDFSKLIIFTGINKENWNFIGILAYRFDVMLEKTLFDIVAFVYDKRPSFIRNSATKISNSYVKNDFSKLIINLRKLGFYFSGFYGFEKFQQEKGNLSKDFDLNKI